MRNVAKNIMPSVGFHNVGMRIAQHGAGNKKGRFCKEAAFRNSGSPTWTRTRDLRINSPSLYRLSYQGIEAIL